MSDDLESKIEEAIKNPRNLGEMKDADAVGTVGSADCGDMLRMWIKFKEEGGRKIIDRATFQSFGCQTAIAVASVATEMLRGKTAAWDRSPRSKFTAHNWWKARCAQPWAERKRKPRRRNRHRQRYWIASALTPNRKRK